MSTMIDSASRSAGSARTRLVYSLVLVVLVTGVPIAFWWVGHQAVIRVSASTGIPSCEGTEATTFTELGVTFEHVAIPMTTGFVCTLTIKVVNDSEREVTLERISVPVAGPRGGAGSRLIHLGSGVVPRNDGIDALADREEPPAGAEGLVGIRVIFRPSGCTPRGGSIRVYPTIVITDLLASHELTLADLPTLLGTANSSCDS